MTTVTGSAGLCNSVQAKGPALDRVDDDSKFELWRSNALSSGLSAATIERLLAFGKLVDFGDRDILLRQGDHSDCAYFIVDGEVEVVVATSYDEVRIVRLSPGALIGETGVFADLPRNATVRACSGVRALRFDRAPLLDAGDADPALLRAIISRLGQQVARFNTAMGLYTNAVAALEQNNFDVSILDELRQPAPELVDFAQHFRRMAEQIVERQARRAEMANAAAIQRAMLPAALPVGLADGRFDVFMHLTPAREVGGDLYDVIDLGGDRFAITIGDVCGKGIPASLFMAVTQTVIRLVVRSGRDLQAEIAAANELVVANNGESMFATLFCGVLDVTSATLTFCNCGHNPPLLLRSGETTFESLRACGPPFGLLDEVAYPAQTVALARGDLLLLYTDGITEAENLQSEQFGTKRLEEAILQERGQLARKVVERVIERVTEFANGAPQSDDITCIALVWQGR